MNETRTINLNGLVYHIDHNAYQLLRDYLQDIEMRLPIDDKKEVMEDLEARIAELFQKALFAKNTQVVTLEMVQSVKSQIGEPSEFGPNRRPKVKVDRSQNAGCGRIVAITLQVLLVLMALPVLGIILTVIFSLVIALSGVTFGLGSMLPMLAPLTSTTGISLSPLYTALIILCVVLLIALPITMLIHTIIIYMRTRRGPKARFWWITIILWLLSLIGLGTMATQVFANSDLRTILYSFQQLDQLDDFDDMPIVSEVRTLEPFNAIDLQGFAEITLHQAPEQQVTVYTHDLSQVTTDVYNNTLYVSMPDQPLAPLKMDIAVPNLSSIRVAGACEIDGDDIPFQAEHLTLDLAGAAKVELNFVVTTLIVDAKGAASLSLEGKAENVTLTISGAGEVDAEDLIAQNMHINCAGASEAEVYVTNELWAQAAGASKITYKGNPQLKNNIAVGGSVICKK